MKVIVVVRHLPYHAPVIMEVISEEKGNLNHYDNAESYLESEANMVIENFKREFPEFTEANFITKILRC